jgi:hypothetical protein
MTTINNSVMSGQTPGKMRFYIKLSPTTRQGILHLCRIWARHENEDGAEYIETGEPEYVDPDLGLKDLSFDGEWGHYNRDYYLWGTKPREADAVKVLQEWAKLHDIKMTGWAQAAHLNEVGVFNRFDYMPMVWDEDDWGDFISEMNGLFWGVSHGIDPEGGGNWNDNWLKDGGRMYLDARIDLERMAQGTIKSAVEAVQQMTRVLSGWMPSE